MSFFDGTLRRAYSAVFGPHTGWKVEIAENGRCGNVIYWEPAGSLRFYWEFGGRALAIIEVGTQAEWNQHHPWAAPRRAEILKRVADEVIRQRAPRSTARLNEERGTLDIL